MVAGSYEVFWSQVAEEDLRSILEYIRAQDPAAARACFEKIRTRAAALDSFPQRGRIVPELKAHGILQYRELILPPWRMIYRISKQQVYVLSVVDSRRNLEDLLLERFTRSRS